MTYFIGNYTLYNLKFYSDLLDNIDKLCEEYISNVRDLLPAERKEYFAKIENAFQKSREYGDDKVQLAVQTYEMVKKYIIYIYITSLSNFYFSFQPF